MIDVIKKFKFKDDGVIINAPKAIETEFVKLGFKTSFARKIKSANTVVFINNSAEYTTFLKKNLESIEPDSVLWFAYPKGTSKIKTDINRDTIRMTGEEYGITTVAAISIDDTWSGLRFRPIDKVGNKARRMPTPEEISNAFHNYRAELESLETKFFWFTKEKQTIYNLFTDMDLLKPLKQDIAIPDYLREQIQSIRDWYEEMKKFWDQRSGPMNHF